MNSIFSSNNITYFMISFSILLIFFFTLIFPYQISINNTNAEIKKMSDFLEEQRILSPFFFKLLKKVNEKEQYGLPFPEIAKLTKNNEGNISRVLKKIAKSSDLEIVNIKPDLSSLIADSDRLVVDVAVKGDFRNIRNFLIMINALPSLEFIEYFQVKTVKDLKEIKLKLWMLRE